MKTTKNTILITGGSAGIGFAIARLFSQKGNHVIITGRDKKRLEEATLQLQNVTAIQSDVSNKDDVERLANQLAADFPSLNLVVNNAGRAFVYNLYKDNEGFEKAADEILTNYLSIIRL